MTRVHVRPHRRSSHHREHHVRVPPGRFSPTVLGFAVAEAEEVLQQQDAVVGYETEAQAQQVQRALAQRGVRTRVIAEVGYPIRYPEVRYETEEMHRLGIEPGARYVRWGVQKTQ